MHSVPFCVALTGGIASGKTAAAERFAALGASVIDADIVARELVAPGSAALAEIVAYFGAQCLDASGALDRRAMREHVFADANARAQLESILHPRIRTQLRARALVATGAYVILAIPLLVERGHYEWIDRVLVIDVPREVQVRRLLARDGVTPALAEGMLAAQATREQRLALADDVIENSGTLAELDERVTALHVTYVALSDARKRDAQSR